MSKKDDEKVMRVKMLASMSGTVGDSINPRVSDVVVVDSVEGARLCDRGLAEVDATKPSAKREKR